MTLKTTPSIEGTEKEQAARDQLAATEERDRAGGAGQLRANSTTPFDRRQGIGSSDAPAILGLDPYRSAFDVWVEKRGDAPPQVEREVMEWGKRLQEPIARAYAEKTKRDLVYLFDQPLLNRERPWQFASPDALCPEEWIVVEVKNVGAQGRKRWGEEGSDEVPEHFYVQGQYQLSTLGYGRIEMPVLFGGNKLVVYAFDEDPALQEIILSRVEHFWLKNVQADIPPRISGTERTRQWLAARYPRHLSGMRVAEPEERTLVLSYHRLREIADTVGAHLEDVAAKLKAQIGDAEGLLLFDLPAVTWRRTKDSKKINWESIARGLKSQVSVEDWDTLLSIHTTMKPGYRRLLVPKPVEDEEETNGRPPEIES